jgi:hypothetical protein
VASFSNRKISEMLRRARASLEAAEGTLRSKASRRARRQMAARNGRTAALRSKSGRTQDFTVLDAPVFFVLGQQRSGTTWLMRILDAHPEILCKGEGRFFGGTWRQRSLKQVDPQRPPSSLYNAMLDTEYLRLWIERSIWSRNEDADEHLINLTRMTIDYFLTSELLKTGKRLVGDKSPLLTPETVREIARIYPEAKVVHIIRDGRDAAVSAVHHLWNFGQGKKSTEVSAKREAYRRNPQALREVGESIFAGGQLRKLAADWSARVGRTVEDGPALLGSNYCEIRYEDLVERPEGEVRRLLVFLGAGADEQSVRRCARLASFERLTGGRKRGREDPTSFFRKGVVGDWSTVFTEQDKTIFKEVAGDLLVQLGYEKDECW